MKIIDYQTAAGDNPQHLDAAVKLLIKADFQPLGVPIVIEAFGGAQSHLVIQTMVKYQQSEVELSESV
jgi:hypothetical protein